MNINENSIVCNGNTAQTSSSSISLTVGEYETYVYKNMQKILKCFYIWFQKIKYLQGYLLALERKLYVIFCP